MTVTNSTYRADYTGNGSTVDFTVPFYFLDTSHIQVLLTVIATGVATTLTLNSDYTVTGAGVSAGGTVTTTATYTSSYKITILRDVPYTQETHYVENDPFPAASHEKALDLLTMQNQQQAELLTRAFIAPSSGTVTDLTLPTPTAGYVLGWDGTGTGIVNVVSGAGSGAALQADLASTASAALGDALIGVKSALTGGVARTQHDKNADTVSVKDFGAKGDSNGTAGNGTDDTAAIGAAFNAAQLSGKAVYFPQGIYRVTTAYTQSTAVVNLRMVGESRSRSTESAGSMILLDNASASVGFFRMTGTGALTVENMTFKCAQYALDRWFFKFESNHIHHFTSVNFINVERPIVYATGCYFQGATLRDVTFQESGTIHSEATTLMGTLLRMDNVNHEGQVPVNTAKILMDLQGVRDVDINTLLLEGALPSTGWTVLRFDVTAWSGGGHSPKTLENAGTINTYWSEWVTNQPTYCLSVTGMKLTVNYCSTAEGFYLNDGAVLTMNSFSGAGSPNAVETLFTFGDTFSLARLNGTDSRLYPLSNPVQVQIKNSQQIYSSSVNDTPVDYPISVDFKQILHKWTGGLLRNTSRVDFNTDAYNGTVRTVETNATYGRVIRVNRGSSAYPFIAYKVFVTPEMVGKPLHLSMLANFPARNGGTYLLGVASWDGGAFGGESTLLDISDSATYNWVRFSVMVPTGATYVVLRTISDSGNVATDLLIAAQEISCGIDVSPYVLPDYPAQTVSYDTAAPTTGIWAVGDIVWKTNVAAAGSPGWVCTTAGTPGTWKTMAAVSA